MQQFADLRTTVRISHRYAAPPARVFDAWLTPQLAGLWLFATASRPMVDVRIDARPSGAFCFVERRIGTTIEHRGHYVEITRPQRLVFLLQSSDCAPKEVPLGGALHVTRVCAEFAVCGTGCELALMHDRLPADCITHVEARWAGMLYGLGVMLRQPDIGELI